ncbi:MAG: radical SAM family heme chaperone HemW [Prevotella sp.]|nr:radical SAM family heme chaperone HemW [Prevotella sp.]
MAGLYLHIPFCKSRCIYCAFYSTTLIEMREKYVDAICKEMKIRHDYVADDVIGTIYLGGGTPSLLSQKQLEKIFNAIDTNFRHRNWSEMEITLECNPDDVTPEYAKAIGQLPVNRVSMGVQSFDDVRLRFLHRRHKAEDIAKAIERLRANGIKNISIDLMFGFPNQTPQEWLGDVKKAVELCPEHISAYSLMVEEGTVLERMIVKNIVEEADEDSCQKMYYNLIDTLVEAGYEHYEISNFAKHGYRSRHNSSYWDGTYYTGIGAGAHSYNGKTRQWNVADIKKYIAGIDADDVVFEFEEIDERTRYNDLITTALRTSNGIDIENLKESDKRYILEMAKTHIESGMLILKNNRLHLSREGLYISNDILSDLIRL